MIPPRALAVAAVLSIPAAARAGALRGDVLVWDDATFYSDASDQAATFQLATLDRAVIEGRIGRAVPMRVVGRTGDFVEVEPVDDGQCTGESIEADDVDHLRVFVREDALSPVIVKPWRSTIGDAAISLGVGEAVLPVDDGRAVVAIDGQPLHLAIPPASIGRSYRAIVPAVPTDRPRFQLVDGTVIDVGEDHYTTSASYPHPAAALRHPRAHATRFPIRTRCSELDAIVPDAAIQAYDPLGYGLTGQGSLDVPGGDRIPKGTALVTPAGRAAGVAHRDIDVTPAAGAATACFDTAVALVHAIDEPTEGVTTARAVKLTLCAPIAHVRHDGPLKLTLPSEP